MVKGLELTQHEAKMWKHRVFGISPFIDSLVKLMLFLLPYDAIRILPSTYKPISLLVLLLLAFFLFPRIVFSKKSKSSTLFLFFYFGSIFYSFLQCFFLSEVSDLFLDYFVTFSIGLLLFLVCDNVFAVYSKNKNFHIEFAKILSYAYVLPNIIALIDLFAVNDVLIPYSISQLIHSVFGGNQGDRVCGVTFEASWLSMHLLFSIGCNLYLLNKRVNKRLSLSMIFIALFVLIFSFSMQGYACLGISVFVYWIYRVKKAKNGKSRFKLLISPILLLVSAIILYFVIVPNIDANSYFLIRLQNLNLEYFLYSDLSAYVRFFNPVMSLMMISENYGLGVGGGMFSYYYEKYVTTYFPWGLDFFGGDNEVVDTINALNASAKCLYTRIIGENGIFSILYFTFLHSCLSKRKSNDSLVFWLIIVLCLMLQFDSMCFFPFLVFLAFYNNLEKAGSKHRPAVYLP